LEPEHWQQYLETNDNSGTETSDISTLKSTLMVLQRNIVTDNITVMMEMHIT
jgi:hypothetical protein